MNTGDAAVLRRDYRGNFGLACRPDERRRGHLATDGRLLLDARAGSETRLSHGTVIG
jgi:hypothetical protein